MKKCLFVVFVSMATGLLADEVLIQDGTVLKGTISSITESVIEVETSFAGTLQVDRAQVNGFSTDNPVFVRLASGAVMPGTVESADAGEVKISGVDGTLHAPLTSVKQGWLKAEEDPVLIAKEQAAEELKRKWTTQVAVHVSGKSGNSEEKSMGASVSSVLTGKHDELKFYGSYSREESEGEKTTDERKVGMRYTSYFHEPWGWYARQELEGDEIENIRLRSVTAAGISRRFANEDHYKLSGNAGLSYRYETYEDGSPDTGTIGLDIGVQHFYRMKNRFEINNELTYVPSIEDFADYLIKQHSWLDFPLGDSGLWKVRMGLKNDYNSMPEGGRKNLDTTYYSSLVVDWK
jgi:putative salt-induced outer membrane protein YdiY